MIRTVGVLDHPKIPATGAVAEEISTALRAWGVDVCRAKTWDTPALEAIMPRVDLIIVLGGDGSTLRAARVAAPHGVPVTSVNMGRLGFLSEMTPATWREALARMVAGDYWLEPRIMIRAEVHHNASPPASAHEALNDIVVSRGTLARLVRTEVFVDGSRLTTYACDGLIVATPTGSTAYALAAGGPILPPTLQNFVLVPIAPHLSLDRPVVLSQGSTVEIIVHTDHQAILTADGQNETMLQHGDRVVVRASAHVAQFARVQPPSYFYRTLMSRLKGEGGDC
jgi:NAD+ kinase